MTLYEKAINHRTIREFTNEKVDEEVLDKIIEGTLRTATSTGMQRSSIVIVTDEEKKKQISEVCNQEYVARAPQLFIFIIDAYRNRKIYEEKEGPINPKNDVDNFFQGYSDAILMAQNCNNLVESFDMGAVFLGSILNDLEKIIEILALPELTLPVLGLAFGHPNEKPQLKPRIPRKYRVFENTYKKEESYLTSLKDYDEEMTTYYDLRDKNNRVDSFSNQVVTKNKNAREERGRLIEVARKNGFKL